MEEKRLSEKESLELISRMIQTTRENMQVGSGNQFLYWGYFTAALSVILFMLVYYTGDSRWSLGWFGMFLFWFYMRWMERKNEVRSLPMPTGQSCRCGWLLEACLS